MSAFRSHPVNYSHLLDPWDAEMFCYFLWRQILLCHFHSLSGVNCYRNSNLTVIEIEGFLACRLVDKLKTLIFIHCQV